MGNCLRSISSNVLHVTYIIKDKCKSYFYPTTFNQGRPLIVMKDDEQHATIMSSDEINSMIQKHQQNESLPPNNINEYKIIKGNNDEEDIIEEKKENIEKIKKEVVEIADDDEEEEEDKDNKDIDQLKNDIFNVNDE